ncbi:MAG: glycerol-3-phosphate acyltransferase [Dehalococcoidia bacterium]|nr:glycerol-3-phosphate acyltransferase [Dehalococcoidia bacterium]
MLVNIAWIAGSYLFGTIPFLAALARASGLNPSQEEDLHIALWHKVGKGRALLGGAADFIKGIIPVLVTFSFELPVIVIAFSGAAAMAGQMWPPSRSGHGERGNTTGGGAVITLALMFQAYFIFLALIPAIAGVSLALFRETGPSKWLPVGALIGFAVAPLASWLSGQPGHLTLGLLVILILIVVRRVTAELRSDLKKDSGTGRILLNRFIFDQPFLEGEKK